MCKENGIQIIDAEENPEAAAKYDIQGLPTMVLLDNDEVKNIHVGSMSVGEMQEFIQ